MPTRVIGRSFFALAMLILPERVLAESRWTSSYLPAQVAGQLSVCTASISYTNGYFMARLYGEELDFLFARNDFTLPYGQYLGTSSLIVDGQSYPLIAFSFERGANDRLATAQSMQLLPKKDDYKFIFEAVRLGSKMTIELPRASYNISLAGSNNALGAAMNCWSRNETGPIENNPFDGAPTTPSTAGSNNPFESL